MGSLIERDNCGNWWLKDVPWVAVSAGATIMKETWEKIYGALCKLKDYEESGLTPDQLLYVDEEYTKMCKEVAGLKEMLNNRWNSAEKEPAEPGEYNVVIEGVKRATTLKYENGSWFDDFNNNYKVFVWQPLPEYYMQKAEFDVAGTEET